MIEKKFHYVFLTTNIVNGKQYIGDRSCTCDPEKDNYIGSGKPVFLNAKRKYGKENFKREILEFFSTKQEAFNAQEKYIKEYNTHVSQGGYNISPKGGHGCKDSWSEESRKKLSASRKGFHHTEETKEKCGSSLRGKFHKESTKEKMSLSHKGIKKSNEHAKHISEGRKGIKFSHEHCKHISESRKGKKPIFSDNGRKVFSNIMSKINQRKILCIYCNYEFNPGNYNRWHGEKCKHKNII
jgi:hypothetical protein